MTFEEAVMDKNRPLSITPREWMTAVEASIAEDDELTENSVKRIAKDKTKAENKPSSSDSKSSENDDSMMRLELGVDQIVQGIKIVYSALDSAKSANYTPEIRSVANKVRDLFDGAISPYIIDVIDELQKLEEDVK